MNSLDFNTAEDQIGQVLIPNKTPLKVRLTIRPGFHNEPELGCNDGWCSTNKLTGSVYLSCEFLVLEGEFKRRKLFNLIGLRSLKGPEWGRLGASFIKAILNSAHGIDPTDLSPKAMEARRVTGFHQLTGLVFVGRSGIDKNSKGEERAVIKSAICPGDLQYDQVMGIVASKRPDKTSTADHTEGLPGWAAA
jgi:hypothetical protein